MKVDQQPILIASPPRCGTTMLAGLIAKHGVWVGNAKKTDYLGTNSDFASENIDIKNIMKWQAVNIKYRNWRVPLPKSTHSAHCLIKNEIERLVPVNIQWLVKTSWTLSFNMFWMDMYPQAKWVFPVRDIESIIDSMNRHPSMRRRPDNMKRKFALALQKRQVETNVCVDGITVDVNLIAQKDVKEITKLFRFLNIDLNWDIVDAFIQPKLMKK